MNKNKKSIFIVIFLLFIVITCVFYYLWADKKQFTDEKNNISNYISQLKSSIDIEKDSINEYCSYGHQKYSKGNLGCEVSFTFLTTSNETYQVVKQKISLLGWSYIGDNTKSTNQYSDVKYINHEVYSHNKFECTFSYNIENQENIYNFTCYAPAKRAWYPVKNE